MENIKSIRHYRTSYDLIAEELGKDVFSDLTEDEVCFLQSVDDYESMSFYVINDKTVLTCDSINGDIIENPIDVNEFMENMFAYVREENE